MILSAQLKMRTQENLKDFFRTAHNTSGMVWGNKYIQGPYAGT